MSRHARPPGCSAYRRRARLLAPDWPPRNRTVAPGNAKTPPSRGLRRCRRRDSNPRHADYDSRLDRLSHRESVPCWTRRWTRLRLGLHAFRVSGCWESREAPAASLAPPLFATPRSRGRSLSSQRRPPGEAGGRRWTSSPPVFQPCVAGVGVACGRTRSSSSWPARRSSSANAICMAPVTSAKRRDSASSATAPAPGCANMITPNATESTPPSPSSSDRSPLSGRSNARAISKMPRVIAHAAMA